MDRHSAAKVLGDISSLGVAVGTLMQWLPAVAALFTILWTATRLYEAVYGRPFSESTFAKFLRGENLV